MRRDLDMLMSLAENRRRRMAANGRPVFDLTYEELAASTHAAMRVAQASKSQVAERAPAAPAQAA